MIFSSKTSSTNEIIFLSNILQVLRLKSCYHIKKDYWRSRIKDTSKNARKIIFSDFGESVKYVLQTEHHVDS